MTQYGGVNAEQLRQYIARIEQLETEKSDITAHVRDIYAEAKSSGYDPKIMRKVIGLRKKDAADREEEEMLLDMYQHALGMTVGKQDEAA